MSSETVYYDINQKRFIYNTTGVELAIKDYPSITFKEQKVITWYIGSWNFTTNAWVATNLTSFTVTAWQSSVDYDFLTATDPMIRVLNANIDSSNAATGILVVTYDADTTDFENAVDAQANGQRQIYIELKGYNVAGKLAFFARPRLAQIYGEMQLDPGSDPTGITATNYYTKSEVDAKIITTKQAVSIANAATSNLTLFDHTLTSGCTFEFVFSDTVNTNRISGKISIETDHTIRVNDLEHDYNSTEAITVTIGTFDLSGNNVRFNITNGSGNTITGELTVKDTVVVTAVLSTNGLTETSGPTTLTIGAIQDAQFLKRVGTTVVGVAVPAGTGDVLGPVANTADYIPQWDGTDSNTLKNGCAVATANTASAIVIRDGSGNFSAGTITANVTGNVSGSAGSCTGNSVTATTASAVTNATLTTALTVNTGTVTLKGNVLNTSALTIGAGAVDVSGSNTGDQTNISGNAATATTASACSGNSATVTGATFTKNLIVNTGNITLKGNADDSSVFTLGSGATVLSGSNTGDNSANTSCVAVNAPIVANTKTKIQYDAKGLVIAGTDATTADIADSADKRYCTDAQKTVIGNTSGTNSGDNAANSSTTYIGTTAVALNRTTGALSLNGVSIDGSAGVATAVTITDEHADTTSFPLFASDSSGNVTPHTNSGITYNAHTYNLATTTFTGALAGNATTATTASAVTNATLTTALTVNTGTVTLTGNGANTSALTIGAGAVTVSGSNTGDNAANSSTTYIGTTSVALNRGSASLSLTGVNIDGSSASCTGNSATVTTNANLTGTVTSVGNATSIASGAIKGNMLQNAPADLGAASVTIDFGNTNGSYQTDLKIDGDLTATNSVATGGLYTNYMYMVNSGSYGTLELSTTTSYLTRNRADAYPVIAFRQVHASSTGDVIKIMKGASTALAAFDISGHLRFDAAAAGITLKQGANGRVGTFVANGATPVTVSNTSVAISDAIIISLNAVGGTVGAHPVIATITAGAGFTTVCTAGDTSTYNYAIIKNAA